MKEWVLSHCFMCLCGPFLFFVVCMVFDLLKCFSFCLIMKEKIAKYQKTDMLLLGQKRTVCVDPYGNSKQDTKH